MAAKLLKNGRLVAIPTETVYGLAANALDAKAVLAIYEAKQRPFFDPLIIHVASLEKAEEYAHFHDPRLLKLAKAFWPGPLTILLPKKDTVPDIVSSGLPQVAVRVPDHELTLELLQTVGLPLAAPSANPFGYVSPTEPQHVDKQLGSKVDYILDGGKCTVGIESTIVGIEDDSLCLYRLGGLAIEEIEKVAGKLAMRLNQSSDPKAPGQLKNHYAPLTPLEIGDIEQLVKKYQGKRIAVIGFGQMPQLEGVQQCFNLSQTSDLKEAALNLFSLLREADDCGADVIITQFVPNASLGLAINDRLKRAEAKRQ